MDLEENLGRCDECGYINRVSVVTQHMKDVHTNNQYYIVDEPNPDIDYIVEEPNPAIDNIRLNEEPNTLQEISNSVVNDKGQEDKLFWKTAHVQFLLSLYEREKFRFDDKKTSNKKIWKDIALEISKKCNIVVTNDQCENKFKNLKKTFKRIVDNNSSSGRGAIQWEHFDTMNKIFGNNPEVTPLSTCSSMGVTGEENTENIENDATSTPSSSRKRKRSNDEEPAWFRKFREDSERRHTDRMQRQDRLLDLLQKIIEKD